MRFNEREAAVAAVPKKPENTRPRRVGPLAPGGSERVRRRRPRSPRSTFFAAPAASVTGSRVSGLEGARDGRASVLWAPLTLRRRLRPSAEEDELSFGADAYACGGEGCNSTTSLRVAPTGSTRALSKRVQQFFVVPRSRLAKARRTF